jgi:hypothetical protein
VVSAGGADKVASGASTFAGELREVCAPPCIATRVGKVKASSAFARTRARSLVCELLRHTRPHRRNCQRAALRRSSGPPAGGRALPRQWEGLTRTGPMRAIQSMNAAIQGSAAQCANAGARGETHLPGTEVPPGPALRAGSKETRDDPAIRPNRATAVTQRYACTHAEDERREAANGESMPDRQPQS